MRWRRCDHFRYVVCPTQISRMILSLVLTRITSPLIHAQLAQEGLNNSTSPQQNSGLIIVPSAGNKCYIIGDFYCKGSELCISVDKLCDGINDCLSREDELGCAPASLTKITNASCGSTVYGSGTLLIPRYSENYGNYISCNWTLFANPPTENVLLDVPSMSLEPGFTFLSYHLDGYDSPRMSGELSSHAIFFAGGPVVITFETNRTSSASGLSLGFRTTPAQHMTDVFAPCGSTLYESGNIRSPNYPGNYSNSLSCNWTLIASPSYGSLMIQILDFNTDSCCDFLSIYNGSTLMHRLSGKIAPHFVLFLDKVAVLSFTTDNSSVSSGFHIWFSTKTVTTIESPDGACKRRGYFYCASSDQCVPTKYRCNGDYDCYYKEDEAGCNSSSTTHLRYSHTYLLFGYVLIKVNFL